MRILVAEDDIRLAALLEESLTEAGWQADVVHDDKSALVHLLCSGGVDGWDLAWTSRPT